MSNEDKRAGWERSDRSYWARPEHISDKIEGDYESQDRVRLSPELVDEIREGADSEED